VDNGELYDGDKAQMYSAEASMSTEEEQITRCMISDLRVHTTNQILNHA